MTETSLAPFSCTYSVDFPDILLGLGGSLVLSTYQSSKVILVSPTADGVVQLPRTFPSAMGLAVAGDRLAVATRDEVVMKLFALPLWGITQLNPQNRTYAHHPSL